MTKNCQKINWQSRKTRLLLPKIVLTFLCLNRCCSDLKNSQPTARSLEQLFLTVGQNNFGKKIPKLIFFTWQRKISRLVSYYQKCNVKKAFSGGLFALWLLSDVGLFYFLSRLWPSFKANNFDAQHLLLNNKKWNFLGFSDFTEKIRIFGDRIITQQFSTLHTYR